MSFRFIDHSQLRNSYHDRDYIPNSSPTTKTTNQILRMKKDLNHVIRGNTLPNVASFTVANTKKRETRGNVPANVASISIASVTLLVAELFFEFAFLAFAESFHLVLGHAGIELELAVFVRLVA